MVVSRPCLGEFESLLTAQGLNVSSDDIKGHIASLRGRLNEVARNNHYEGQKNATLGVVRPLHLDLNEWTIGRGLEVEDKSELLWNLLRVATLGTTGAAKIALITDDQDSWNDVMVLLENSQGIQPAVPAFAFSWRQYLPAFVTIATLFVYLAADTGRTRLIAFTCCLLGAVSFVRSLLPWAEELRRTWLPLCTRRSSSSRIHKPAARPDIMQDLMQEIESSSSSAALRIENEELKTAMSKLQSAVDELKVQQDRPLSAPPFAPEHETGEASAESASSSLPGLVETPSPRSPAAEGEVILTSKKGEADPKFSRDPQLDNWIGTKVFTDGQSDSPVEALITAASQIEVQLVLLGSSLFFIRSWDEITFGGSNDWEIENDQTHDHRPLTYAPFAGEIVNKVKVQAARLRAALKTAVASKAAVPDWPGLFWRAVAAESSDKGLEEKVEVALQACGYYGPSTVGAPRHKELDKMLSDLASTGGASLGLGPSPTDEPGLGSYSAGSLVPVHQKLPAELPRAAPETYRSIRSEGVGNLRQWILEQFPIGQRSGQEFGHLFQSCCQADFLLADCTSESQLFERLNSSDQLEIILRDVGAFIYERRTGDRVGGSHMRALRIPGANVDILPTWMIQEGTMHSRVEHNRKEVVSAGRNSSDSKGKGQKGTSKGSPKGGGKKKSKPPSGGSPQN